MSPEHFLDYEFDVVSGATSFEGALFRLTPKSDGRQLPAVRYRMNPLPIILATGRILTPCCADLLSVAWHVNLADRLAPRSAPGDRRPPDNRWSRRLALRVPVHDPEPWHAAVTSGLLREYLGYLSDDYWDLVFVSRPSDSEMQGLLWADVPRQSSINLFSGGMDSFLGIVDAARNLRNGGTVLAASVIASDHHRALQAGLLGALRPHLGRDIRWARLDFTVRGVERGSEEREASWRTRSFLYSAVGAVVARLSNTPVVHMNENGIGAINLPMTDDVISSKGTRAAHPRALLLFSKLLQIVLDVPLVVENPFHWSTKGQMCNIVKNNFDLLSLLLETVSCDRFPYLPPSKSCGRCVPCLLRAVSLNAADWRTAFPINLGVRENPEVGCGPTARYAMAFQAERLRNILNGRDPEFAMIEEFPGLVDVIASLIGRSSFEGTMQSVIRLYSRYLTEWDLFTRSLEASPIAA